MLDLASCLLTTLLDVWEYRGKLPSSTLIMVQAVSKVVERSVWLKLWRQEMLTITERMITILELVPDLVLECFDDVAPLVKSMNPAIFCLSLPLTRLVMASKIRVESPVLVCSLGYWAARGCIAPPAGSVGTDIQTFLG